MGEQSIKKDIGEYIVDQAIKVVNTWADKELHHIRSTANFPVCIPLTEKSWTVGKYTLIFMKQNHWSVKNNDGIIHVFYSKKAAVFYAIFSQFNKFKLADEILEADKSVAKYSDEMDFYSKKLKKNRDTFTNQLNWIKYVDAKIKLKSHKLDLEKKLSHMCNLKRFQN